MKEGLWKGAPLVEECVHFSPPFPQEGAESLQAEPHARIKGRSPAARTGLVPRAIGCPPLQSGAQWRRVSPPPSSPRPTTSFIYYSKHILSFIYYFHIICILLRIWVRRGRTCLKGTDQKVYRGVVVLSQPTPECPKLLYYQKTSQNRVQQQRSPWSRAVGGQQQRCSSRHSTVEARCSVLQSARA